MSTRLSLTDATATAAAAAVACDDFAARPDTFEEAFWRSLWREPDDAGARDGGAPCPWESQPGFAVYRNTVLQGCVDALLALYPAVHRLTGTPWLAAAALAYARRHPPTQASLHRYGEGFAAFMNELLQDDALPWLPEVAHIDRLWQDCHAAADAPVLSPQEFVTRMQAAHCAADRSCAHAQDDAAEAAMNALRLHPAARWRWCGQWPAYELWHAAREALPDPNPSCWQGQGVLLTRPGGTVLCCALSQEACRFLDACARHVPPHEAAALAVQRSPAGSEPDFGRLLALLIHQGAFAAMES